MRITVGYGGPARHGGPGPGAEVVTVRAAKNLNSFQAWVIGKLDSESDGTSSSSELAYTRLLGPILPARHEPAVRVGDPTVTDANC